LADYERDRLGFLLALPAAYGDLASFDARTTVVNDFGLAHAILRDHAGAFAVQQNFLGQQVDSHELEAVLRIRRHLNPGLRPQAVTRVAHDVAVLTERRLASRQLPFTFEPLSVAEQVISEAFSWHLFGAERAPFVAQVAELLDSLELTIGNVFAPPASWRTPLRRRIERQHGELLSGVIEVLRSKGDDLDRRAHAHAIAWKAQDSDDPHALGNLVIGAMLAAQRVPASGASWTLLMVAERPEWQERLRDEANRLRDALHRGEAVQGVHFPLALAFVHETLRLYPPTWLITRTSTTPVTLGGYEFPAGQMFLISPYVLHRDERTNPRAQTFDPSRWLSGDHPRILSFGSGRHRCPGTGFAMNALVAFLLTVVQGRDLSVTVEPRAEMRNTLRPAGLAIRAASSSKHKPRLTQALPTRACSSAS